MFPRMCHAVLPQFEAIHSHPFNVSLARGDLPIPIFRNYLVQDGRYLRAFRKGLEDLSRRADNKKHAGRFIVFARDVKCAELEVHRKFLAELPSPAFFRPKRSEDAVVKGYIQHLRSSAKRATLPEAIAAFLPCYEVYRQLGETMTVAPDNRYRAWIETYSGDSFKATTKEMIQIFEETARSVICPMRQDDIFSAFAASIQHEKDFFDSVCRDWRLINESQTPQPFKPK